jgi:uncharacterized phage protein gp47/JayE
MIDVGHPFTRSFVSLIEAFEQRLRAGVERPDTYSFVFQRTTTSYALPPAIFAVTRVSGLMNARFQVFAENVDYMIAGNRLVWIDGGARPDDNKRVEVEYTVLEEPSGITDFNQGSVAGTLVRVISREMAQLYAQMDEAYRRAFIDHASGVALDNVVALVGVQRIEAEPAAGEVTFFRKAPSPRPIVIPRDTRVADQAGRLFVTTAEGTIPATTAHEELLAPAGRILKVTRPIAELTGVWPVAADPGTATPLAAGATFGPDARTITLNANPPAGDLRVRYIPRAATVPVKATEPGPEGNVNAGTITVMPTPPPGVEGVVNERPLTGGHVEESDERLRERARHALERAGNATLDAIKFAVLGLEGVEGVEVIDHAIDDDVPLGEVRVRYSGGRVEDVRRTVEATRAAGVIARLEAIEDVLVSGTFYLIPDEGGATPAATPAFLARIGDLLRGQAIGAPLSLRRLNATAFEVAGLAEVAEAQLRFARNDGTAGDVTDPFLITPTEVIRPDEANLKALFLTGLRQTASALLPSGATRLRLTMQVLDATGAPVRFRRLSLDVTVGIRARSLTAPEAPPERIGSLTKRLEFTNSTNVSLNITPAELASFRPADHDPRVEFVVEPSAYPGLAGTTNTVAIA